MFYNVPTMGHNCQSNASNELFLVSNGFVIIEMNSLTVWVSFSLQTISFTLTLFVADYCTPLGIIIYCYYFIVKAIVQHERALREQAAKMNVTSLRSKADTGDSAEIRVAKAALLNISLWVAMWTPYASIVIQGALGYQHTITPLVTILPALIAKSASIANPIIFAISHPKYRLVHFRFILALAMIYQLTGGVA